MVENTDGHQAPGNGTGLEAPALGFEDEKCSFARPGAAMRHADAMALNGVAIPQPSIFGLA
jgi:hypothetical protein